MTFDEAFEILIGHEGGYVNHPNDPGGETKYGISKRSYPHENIKGMTLERAKIIYERDYWKPCGAAAVDPIIAFDLFDTAVNAGVTQAVRFLQRAAGVTVDGIIGLKTLRSVASFDPYRLVARFNGHRLDHLNNLPTWPSFGKGWAQRIADNLVRL